jgi:hypothetical protein
VDRNIKRYPTSHANKFNIKKYKKEKNMIEDLIILPNDTPLSGDLICIHPFQFAAGIEHNFFKDCVTHYDGYSQMAQLTLNGGIRTALCILVQFQLKLIDFEYKHYPNTEIFYLPRSYDMFLGIKEKELVKHVISDSCLYIDPPNIFMNSLNCIEIALYEIRDVTILGRFYDIKTKELISKLTEKKSFI